jgi:hypothetical protein
VPEVFDVIKEPLSSQSLLHEGIKGAVTDTAAAAAATPAAWRGGGGGGGVASSRLCSDTA